uniref:Cysteine-rich receptor-like protein kinase 10 n=1 Tax=Fagus sylvatica TaxID=28930 RepID=A0A2N9J0P4_FAGSY
MKNKCSREKIAVIWYDECLLRYSNRSFFSTVDEKPKFRLYNTQNVTDQDKFNKLLNMTMIELARETTSNVSIGDKKFRTKEVNISTFQTLYNLVQCTPDLNSTGCNNCLLAAINLLPWCCSGKQGGRIVFPSCNFRYELYPFYRMIATALTPSPGLQPPPSPPGSSSRSLLTMTTAIPNPQTQTPFFLLSNFSNYVTVKLDHTNYLMWKFQITGILDAYSLLDHLEDPIPCPSKFLLGQNGAEIQEVNAAYVQWKSRDKTLFSLLSSTLSPSAISLVMGQTTASGIWKVIHNRYTSISRSSIVNLKHELHSIKKHSDSVTQYLQKIKEARDKLVSVGVFIDDEEILHIVLQGLPTEYHSFTSAMLTKNEAVKFEELHTLMKTEEDLLKSAVDNSKEIAHMAMAASKNFTSPSNAQFSVHHGGRGRNQTFSHRGRGNGGHGRSQYYNGRGNPNSNSNFSPNSPNSQSWNTNQGSRPTCQICHKLGHTAIDCYQRMNYAFQGRHPLAKLAAMATATPTPPEPHQTTWISDTGATDHFTPDIHNLPDNQAYTDPQLVSVGNGHQLPITHIGNSQLRTSNYLFNLRKILRVPSMKSNLLSVQRFCRDNFCSFSFDAHHFQIQDLLTGRPLYKGISKDGLYPIRGLSLPSWHSRLSSAFSPSRSVSPNSASPVSSKACPQAVCFNASSTACPPAASSNISPHICPPAACHNISQTNLWHMRLGHPQTRLFSITFGLTQSHHHYTASQLLSIIFYFTHPAPIPSLPISSSHPMQTRSKSGIIKKKSFASSTTINYLQTEPPTYTIASKIPEWREAMASEFAALHRQKTWSLVPSCPDHNIIGCRWVYKIKRNTDGSVSRYKARLVAKGFHQQAGVDFDETFSPVVKPPTVRIILSLAAQNQWSLRQLDVSNAFLHGLLKENVYMTQPIGFIDSAKPSHVCQLHKSLYGLKQAPRAWFERFTSHLLTLGFSASVADASLFILHHGSTTVYLLLYVDDIIITGNNPTAISDIITQLSNAFELKDLGPLRYFLGLQIDYKKVGLFVHQHKYITDLLTKFHMTECKAASTPIATTSSLSTTTTDLLSDPTPYRSLVGALQYATFTRPDITFAVNRILFQPGPLALTAFTDADWAGDTSDRRSTSGVVVFLGNNPITWLSKKQHTVSRSSTEAEYRSLATGAAELAWLRQVLCDLKLYLPSAPLIWCDNTSALALASNPVFHGRTKHIEVDYHFVRERVVRGDLSLQFISTHDQLADIFTKALPSTRFLLLCSKLLKTLLIHDHCSVQHVSEPYGENDITTIESLQFDFDTIESATNKFSEDNKLGEGGFGTVYKGTLPNRQEIAVKRLSKSSGQGVEQFKNEVVVVAQLQHRNLARLLGFCLEGEEKILVYEFVPNKSLDYILYDPKKQGQLDWSKRYKIIGRIARGIQYLHEDSRLRIIHRDLKASNVLLDADMNPKISDFGMARIFGVDQTQGNTSRIVGDIYAMHGEFSVKSDVYSFGVLVLEIISGKKNSNFYESEGAEDLLSYVWIHWRDGRPLELLDPTLGDSFSRDEVMRCIHLGLLCVQEDPADRPTMAMIVLTLNSGSVTLPSPQQPAFFLRSKTYTMLRKNLESDQSPSKSMPWSVNEVSITELDPR